MALKSTVVVNKLLLIRLVNRVPTSVRVVVSIFIVSVVMTTTRWCRWSLGITVPRAAGRRVVMGCCYKCV